MNVLRPIPFAVSPQSQLVVFLLVLLVQKLVEVFLEDGVLHERHVLGQELVDVLLLHVVELYEGKEDHLLSLGKLLVLQVNVQEVVHHFLSVDVQVFRGEVQKLEVKPLVQVGVHVHFDVHVVVGEALFVVDGARFELLRSEVGNRGQIKGGLEVALDVEVLVLGVQSDFRLVSLYIGLSEADPEVRALQFALGLQLDSQFPHEPAFLQSLEIDANPLVFVSEEDQREVGVQELQLFGHVEVGLVNVFEAESKAQTVMHEDRIQLFILLENDPFLFGLKVLAHPQGQEFGRLFVDSENGLVVRKCVVLFGVRAFLFGSEIGGVLQ